MYLFLIYIETIISSYEKFFSDCCTNFSIAVLDLKSRLKLNVVQFASKLMNVGNLQNLISAKFEVAYRFITWVSVILQVDNRLNEGIFISL